MATLNLVLVGLLELENADLARADVAENLAGNAGLGRGLAGDHLVVGADGEHFAELHRVPGLAGEGFDFNPVARRDAVLLPAGTNQGIHGASRRVTETNII